MTWCRSRLPMRRRFLPRLVLLALVASAGILVDFTTHGEAAPRPARVLAVVQSLLGPTLEPLDARTLRPVSGGWSLPLGWSFSGGTKGPVALSPSGSRVAATTGLSGDGVVVVDVASGRVLWRYNGLGDTLGLYWLGGERLKVPGGAVLMAVTFDCASLGCGDEFTIVGQGDSVDFNDDDPVGALPEGVVMSFASAKVIIVYGQVDEEIGLKQMPLAAPHRLVVDVAHDRLFQISSAGIVAEVDHVATRPTVTYHRVELNGQPFQAVWAGAGKIALWGKDGLGTIDTRTWKTHAIAPGVTDVVATPFGLATWTNDPNDGLTVYRPDGSLRLGMGLEGKRVKAVYRAGEYLYVDANARHSVNLRTGTVTGPLRSNATIVEPEMVPLP